MLDYLTKAVDLLGYIFELVSKILVAVNGEESDEVAEMENTKVMVGDIADAVKTFAEQAEELSK